MEEIDEGLVADNDCVNAAVEALEDVGDGGDKTNPIYVPRPFGLTQERSLWWYIFEADNFHRSGQLGNRLSRLLCLLVFILGFVRHVFPTMSFCS